MVAAIFAPVETPDSLRTTLTHPHVIVGTNGSPGSDGALKTAALLMESGRARASVVGVVPVADEEVDLGPARSRMLEDLLMQLARVSPGCVTWSIEIRRGDPATVLSELAQQRDARLIITGLGHHDHTLDRFGAETTLSAVHRSRTPVLAVPESFDALPTSAIVFTDFSARSLSAASESLALFPTLRIVNLVHRVIPTERDLETLHRWTMPSGRNPISVLGDERRRIAPYAGVDVKTTLIKGDAVPWMLELARSTGADIIVAGSRGAALAQRLIIGSTAAHAPPCTILAVPAIIRRSWSKGTVLEGRYSVEEIASV